MDSLTETSIEQRQEALDRMGVPPLDQEQISVDQAAEELSPRREDAAPTEIQYHKQGDDGQPVRDEQTGRFARADDSDITPERGADDLQAWRDSQSRELNDETAWRLLAPNLVNAPDVILQRG